MATTIMKIGRLASNIAKQSINDQCRFMGMKLIYKEYGDPVKVVKQEENGMEEKLEGNEIIIKMLASPINPADINTIQGKYPVKPALPSVPGNEGVGEICEVGSQVKNLKPGDRVVLATNAMGAWRTHLKIPYNFVHKIPRELGLIEAATLTVNPCTAYRMLRDYVPIKPGDTVIQNGGNSAVGQNVIQIAKAWGIKTVNIVRNRPTIDELKEYLFDLGANCVLTEEELRSTQIFKSGQIKKPKLAFNCVGGKSSLELIRHLDIGGTMVTYGGMSREPVMVATGPLIFKDVCLRGFWMTQWTKEHENSPERKEMLDEIVCMMLEGVLQKPVATMVPLSEYKNVLEKTTDVKGQSGSKFIFEICPAS